LQATNLPIGVGTGGCTKYNRIEKKLPKTHWLDAVCVGASTPEIIKVEGMFASLSGYFVNRRPLSVKPKACVAFCIIATGHGNRQMYRVDKYGFPRTKAKQFKRVHGFQSGDMVKAVVPTGKKTGAYIGRVAVRTSGSFNLKTENGIIQGISYRYCHLLQRSDGYNYKEGGTALPYSPLNGEGLRA